ncbi:MAG: zinc ribbon domain-containing protein [Lachnospiraceae bacterium]|nr:zinc ribbon domain-containing protein [Lachnospiraceae bacterium]
MGGVRVNGCGVTDHFKRIKSLGVHVCPKCKRPAEFTLDEAKQKIDVLWIPTFTLKSRYAVMCSNCKNGQFCSDEWAGHLLNQTETPKIIFEGAAKALAAQTNTVKEQVTMPVNSNISQTKPAVQPKMVSSSSSSHFFTCLSCGITQMREGDVCSYCGEPVPKFATSASEQTASVSESAVQAVPSGTGITCPSCGNVQEAGGKFCIICGQKLGAEQRKDKFCSQCGAKLTEGMLFCMECGSKI